MIDDDLPQEIENDDPDLEVIEVNQRFFRFIFCFVLDRRRSRSREHKRRMYSFREEIHRVNHSSFYAGRTRSRSNERRSDRRSSRDRQDSSRRRSRDRDRDRGRRTGNFRGENEIHNNNGNGPHDTFGITDGY